MSNFSMGFPPFQNQDPLAAIKNSLKKDSIGSDQFYQTMETLMTMADGDNMDAKLLLARALVQKGSLKNASKKALHYFNEVAKTGNPQGIEGVADLLLWGVGIKKNETESFKLYKKLAQMGYIPMTVLAYFYSHEIGVEENQNLASNLILKAAAQGDTLAFILLAHRFSLGYGVPFDPTLAAAYATLAQKRQFPGADIKLQNIKEQYKEIQQSELDELVIQLIHSIEKLADASEQLAARIPPNNPAFIKQYLQLLETNQIELGIRQVSFNSEKRGYEYQIKPKQSIKANQLSKSPSVTIYENFASYEECQYLINQSLPILTSTAEQIALNPNSEIDAFTGSSAVLSAMYSSPVSRIVQQRFADLVNTPVSYFEPVSVLKYLIGDEYTLHTDAFNEERILNHQKVGDFGGQRITTNLVYLLPAIEGGETEYTTPNLIIKGQVGMAIIHSNSTSNFEANENSFHIGKPILKGEKWIMRNAVRRYQLFGNNKSPLTK